MSSPWVKQKHTRNIHAIPSHGLLWVSRIEEQRRRMKNNEEKNPKLLFVLFYVLFITIFAFNNNFEYKIKKNDIV